MKVSFHKYIINAFFILISVAFIIPLWSVVAVSLSSDNDVIKYGYRLIPKMIDFTAYKIIMENPQQLLSAYRVTIISSAIGLFTYLLISSMCAYALSRYGFKYRGVITFYLFFTMLFNGGLVPQYILMTKYLNLQNTYFALILPLLGNVWYLFLMRTFFAQIPVSIIESAKIDGCSEMRIYLTIILPLSKPALATVGLFTLLDFWNSWFPALLYVDKNYLIPLQYLLQIMLRNIEQAVNNMHNLQISNLTSKDLPLEGVRMAMCILAAGPMLIIFPFFQKYFVTGLTIGAVKG